MTRFRTRGPAIDPALRTTKHRRAVRVLLLAADAVLLFRDTDPGLPGTGWWMTPGGGVDPGETDVAAVVREIQEETGLRIAADQVRGPIATRTVLHGYSDQITSQDEAFFVVESPAQFAVSTAGHTPDEQLSVVGHQWWPRTELVTTPDVIWPADLPELIELARASTRWPIDLGEVEESTVPIGRRRSGEHHPA